MEAKEPKDLGVKIGNKEMAKWKEIIDAQEEVILNSNINLIIGMNVLELAQAKYELEKAKFEQK